MLDIGVAAFNARFSCLWPFDGTERRGTIGQKPTSETRLR